MTFSIMNSYICFALVVGFSSIFGFSMLTDSDSQNATYSEEAVSISKNTNVFQQLLNQETIIRMSMVKNIHVLMKDMLILKQSLISAEGDISTLKQTTTELKKDLHKLEQENERLSKENDKCKENLSGIRETEKNTSHILADMKIEVRYLSITLLNLNQKVTDDFENVPKLIDNKYSLVSAEMNMSLVDYQTDLTAMADEMNKTIHRLRHEVKQSEFEQLKLSSAVSSLEVFRMNFSKNDCESSEKVAFTAGMTAYDSSFSDGTLVFPAVITNIGSGYNPSTGIFSAPNDGLYVFYVSGLEYSTKYLRLDIVLNGISKVRLIGESAASYQTGTNMVVLNLQQGDRVWVKHSYGAGYYSQSVPITTFSGFQI